MAKVGYVLAPGIKGYTQWRKALWTDPELRERFTVSRRNKWDARQVAEVIAMFGDNGRNCHPGAEVVAERLGCRRAVVETQREWLTDHGWFLKVRPVRRTFALDIAIPDHVAWEWRAGDRSWAGRQSGVFTVELGNLTTGVLIPDAPGGDGVNWYPDDEWKPNQGKPPF